MIPLEMDGEILYPLNILKEKLPKLYEKQASKYSGREHVMDQFIPTLGCRWNDVLHLSPIHPEELKKALTEAGIQTREMKFYQINPLLLDPKYTTIYLNKHIAKEDSMEPQNFAPYDPNAIIQYSVVSEATKAYYKEMHIKHERPLLYVKVPHILYKGSIDTRDLPIVTIAGDSWNTYAEKTKNKPPAKSLLRALDLVQIKGNALDLGAGSLNDTKYLLEAGFSHVTALDSTPLAKEVAAMLPIDKFAYVISTYADFKFPNNQYDLVNAQYALPFNPPESFERVFKDIIGSLKHGGVFVGQLFGTRDAWNISSSGKSFHTAEEAKKLLSGLEIIEFTEEEAEKPTAAGTMKHWHVFHFIAQKNY